MREPEVVAAYAADLAERLDFDPVLSRRVRQEVEDHLQDAADANPSGTERSAAEQAIADFGDPKSLAAEFATAWLGDQTQKMNAVAAVTIAASFAIMKARLAWYEFVDWPPSRELLAGVARVGQIDAFAFWLAVILLLAGWACLLGHRGRGPCREQCRKLRRVVYLSFLSTTALTLSVCCDVALTALRHANRDPSAQSIVPISSVAAEIVLLGLLLIAIRALYVRLMRTVALAGA